MFHRLLATTENHYRTVDCLFSLEKQNSDSYICVRAKQITSYTKKRREAHIEESTDTTTSLHRM